MPTYARQQWGRYDLTKQEVEAALLKAVDASIFPTGAHVEVVTFGDGSAYIRGFVGELECGKSKR